MATGFSVSQIGGYTADLDDILMRREYLSDGTIFTWGRNDTGQLGNPTFTMVSSPSSISGEGISWRSVSCGRDTCVAIKTDGSRWGWGYNIGSLGDGVGTARSSPVPPAAVNDLLWKSVSAGANFSAGIKTNGTLWTCGANPYGQLGNGTATNTQLIDSTSGGGTNWKLVVCGDRHMAAIKTDGTLWTWGFGVRGALGDGTSVSKRSPVTTAPTGSGGTNWKSVTAGYDCTAAIKTDGTLWTWGYNGNGQLGDNSFTSRNSPVPIAGGGTNWKSVSMFGTAVTTTGHTAAVKTDGTLWTWGSNGNGQLGTGSASVDKSSPSTTAGGGTNWKSVACGGYHTAAIKTDGTLWTWGSNNYGKLGDTTINDRASPGTVVGGRTNWKSVSCGEEHTAATTDLSF